MAQFHKYLFATILLAVVAASGSSKIAKSLEQHFLLGEERAKSQSVIVSFNKEINTVIDQINMLPYDDIVQKRNILREAQIKFSNDNQRAVQDALKLTGVKYETFWINNKMHIPKADYRLVKLLTQFPSVVAIEKEMTASMGLPAQKGVDGQVGAVPVNMSGLREESSVPWGIHKIRAQQVWQNYTGRGIVVATIDTGVRATHEALESNWRSQYGWYDPMNGTESPGDEAGHGTHVMGTIAGTHGIGVAPDAIWIACRACGPLLECPYSDLVQCSQWIMCPTLANGQSKNCAMAPNIVSNSWAFSNYPNHAIFDDVVNSWRAAGIIPVFSVGNAGDKCKTVEPPGSQPNTIGVGNVNMFDRIRRFSGRGPNRANQIKPDITAPGTDTRSAWHQADNQYALLTGTSMSCPHVSGVIALMLQKNPGLKYQNIYKIITSTAETSSINAKGVQTCGGIEPNQFPNNAFGYGRVDAINAVNAI